MGLLNTCRFNLGTWCNGSTTDFGSVCLSPNLGVPTIIKFVGWRQRKLALELWGTAQLTHIVLVGSL